MGKYVAQQTKILFNKVKISNSNIAFWVFLLKKIYQTLEYKIFQIVDQLKKWKSKVKIFDSVASDLDTKRYKINYTNLKLKKI